MEDRDLRLLFYKDWNICFEGRGVEFGFLLWDGDLTNKCLGCFNNGGYIVSIRPGE